jgi:hypothetical protein
MIFRYKYSSELIQELKGFSRNNYKKNLKEQKSEWLNFIKTNIDLITKEYDILKNINYNKKNKITTIEHLIDQLWKSNKYYYIKKLKKEESVEVEKEVEEKELIKPKRNYNKNSKEFLETINRHIEEKIEINKENSPDELYQDFIKTKKEELSEEIKNYIDINKETKDNTAETLIKKFKKTYKNKYYKIIRK